MTGRWKAAIKQPIAAYRKARPVSCHGATQRGRRARRPVGRRSRCETYAALSSPEECAFHLVDSPAGSWRINQVESALFGTAQRRIRLAPAAPTHWAPRAPTALGRAVAAHGPGLPVCRDGLLDRRLPPAGHPAHRAGRALRSAHRAGGAVRGGRGRRRRGGAHRHLRSPAGTPVAAGRLAAFLIGTTAVLILLGAILATIVVLRIADWCSLVQSRRWAAPDGPAASPAPAEH